MLDERDVLDLLTLQGAEREELFARARERRTSVYGDRVVVRGVCEVTNICRVNCEFCPMRRDNTRSNDTYQQHPDDLVRTARTIHAHDVNVICFQGGEIPQTTTTVAAALPAVRALYDDKVEVLLNLGNKTHAEYAALRQAGATSYIIKHETSDPQLNRRMRHESLDARLACIRDLIDLGYRVGTGTIVGLPGQRLESIAADIILARDLGVHLCSASVFIPAPDTPLADCPPGDVELTLTVLAVMRLVNPAWAIPSVSALEKLRPGAQRRGLQAGANVINVNFTDPAHRGKYLIYGRDRLIAGYHYVRTVIADAGLVPGHSAFVAA
jgi:biotin synthase